MNKAANTYWVDTRLSAQRPQARTLSLTDAASAWVGTPAEIRRRGGLVPSWAVFLMVMLASFALCVSLAVRTQAKLTTAGERRQQMLTEVESLRHTNETLKRDVHRLRTDPRAIEAAARSQLSMVRANEIIVPVE
ncbi:MAG: FtsB family cell division protein [Pyrinomonadaceae bacterium]